MQRSAEKPGRKAKAALPARQHNYAWAGQLTRYAYKAAPAVGIGKQRLGKISSGPRGSPWRIGTLLARTAACGLGQQVGTQLADGAKTFGGANQVICPGAPAILCVLQVYSGNLPPAHPNLSAAGTRACAYQKAIAPLRRLGTLGLALQACGCLGAARSAGRLATPWSLPSAGSGSARPGRPWHGRPGDKTAAS